jgi:hypothetical protein
MTTVGHGDREHGSGVAHDEGNKEGMLGRRQVRRSKEVFMKCLTTTLMVLASFESYESIGKLA